MTQALVRPLLLGLLFSWVNLVPAATPSSATLAAQATAAANAPFGDQRDLDFAHRGYIATRDDPVIRGAQGQSVWDLKALDFLQGPRPDTVNPSLWRQSQLLAIHGLFQVSARIWQVRGFDLANITFVAGDHGWIVVDTLSTNETAHAALELANGKLGPRPIVAIIYTHPHADHFGGAGGLIDAEAARSGQVQVIAPKGFLASAVGENVIAGPAMQRRATYQFGVPLLRSAEGQVSSGIGPGLAVGTSSLIPPNVEIERTGQALTLDGVRMVFQMTPGTEAPAEMNIDFPDWHVIDMAENANATQHNILTPRGAVVRDAKGWADHLTESLALFGDSEILMTSHGWPRFGQATIRDYLGKHRDLYAYLHDQTVRLMNRGLNGDEIAARLQLPAALQNEWYDRPYYGSLSFNARAVYQYYMGWYDGNPVHLSPSPPAETGRRYVAAMGGRDKVVAMARQAHDAGDDAWASELLNRVVMANANDMPARQLLADCYDQLGFRSENSLWRNIYLTGASELRNGVSRTAPQGSGDALAKLPTDLLFDMLAVRLDADKVGSDQLRLEFVFPDRQEQVYVTVENGVLIHQALAAPGPVDASVTMNRADLMSGLIGGSLDRAMAKARIEGDPAALGRLASWIDRPVRGFPLVTR